MTTANLLTLALLVVMMLVWTLIIRHWQRKTVRRAEELAEAQRELRETEQVVLDAADRAREQKECQSQREPRRGRGDN